MRAATLALLAVLCAACAEEPAAPEAAATPAPAAAPPADEIQTAPVAQASAPPATATQVASAAPRSTEIAPLPMSLTYAQVEKSLAFHRRHFHGLYLGRLKAKPKLRGMMLVSFQIAPDGTAHDATLVQSTLGDPVFEKEILAQVDATRFPPATGPTPVERYPFEFSPQPK